MLEHLQNLDFFPSYFCDFVYPLLPLRVSNHIPYHVSSWPFLCCFSFDGYLILRFSLALLIVFRCCSFTISLKRLHLLKGSFLPSDRLLYFFIPPPSILAFSPIATHPSHHFPCSHHQDFLQPIPALLHIVADDSPIQLFFDLFSSYPIPIPSVFSLSSWFCFLFSISGPQRQADVDTRYYYTIFYYIFVFSSHQRKVLFSAFSFRSYTS